MQNKEAIEEYLYKCGADGHSIIVAESLVKMGFDFEFVAKFARNHESGDDFKEMIFDKQGKVMPDCYGVNSLSFLYGIADDIGANTRQARMKYGRGSQAGCLVEAIKNKLRLDVPTE
jgi:hypothetical protein